jgi:mannose-6-phosphate isomerase-like protein (cupin superfamily)
MTHKLVFRVQDVEGFSLPGAEESFVSRLLIDAENVGSHSFVINHFTLKHDKYTDPGGSHPVPFDEAYYVLRGTGRLFLGDPPEEFDLVPGTVVFIPGGTAHSVVNTGTDDLELLTVMAGPLKEGVNPVYDARREAWGTTFKLKSAK